MLMRQELRINLYLDQLCSDKTSTTTASRMNCSSQTVPLPSSSISLFAKLLV
jgi:hypothetical protein